MTAVANAVFGLSYVLLPFCDEFWFFALMAALYGVSSAAHIVLSGEMIIELVGNDGMELTAGVLLAARGLGMVTGDFLAGHFYDVTGDTIWSCVVCGGIVVTSAIILEVLPPTSLYVASTQQSVRFVVDTK